MTSVEIKRQEKIHFLLKVNVFTNDQLLGLDLVVVVLPLSTSTFS